MRYQSMPITKYLKELSSAKPIPGGGSAAALVASVGVSLSLMVARITIKKLKGDKRGKCAKLIKDLSRVQKRIQVIIDKDPAVYEKLIKSYRLPKANKKRARQIGKSLTASYGVMKELCLRLRDMSVINKKLITLSRGTITNDLLVSQLFIKSSLNAAAQTAHVNIYCMKSVTMRKKLSKEIQHIKKNS
ncbi:MAG: cyclodeaminase/cyclohydrolase family protein [Candidatus Omnitrophica bacterium]|nr:cyclodeaminase/cyclohydrolase family protein [Candidatus Omnitrophota bacterium]